MCNGNRNLNLRQIIVWWRVLPILLLVTCFAEVIPLESFIGNNLPIMRVVSPAGADGLMCGFVSGSIDIVNILMPVKEAIVKVDAKVWNSLAEFGVHELSDLSLIANAVVSCKLDEWLDYLVDFRSVDHQFV